MKVLAAIDDARVGAAVADFATHIADLLGADVEAVHVRTGAKEPVLDDARMSLRVLEGPVVATLRAEAQAPDVAALVVGARGAPHGPLPAGHVTQELMTSLPRPLVIVPPNGSTRPLRRVMAALDGSVEAAQALDALIRRARDAGLEVDVVHVLDPQTAPPFEDQSHHWAQAFAREFGARHVPSDGREVELRVGGAPDRLLKAANELDADLVALAWRQVLAPGRAAVVQHEVANSSLPVMLVPVAPH